MEGQIIWVDCADDKVILDKDWIWEIRAKHQDLFAKVDSDDSDNMKVMIMMTNNTI